MRFKRYLLAGLCLFAVDALAEDGLILRGSGGNSIVLDGNGIRMRGSSGSSINIGEGGINASGSSRRERIHVGAPAGGIVVRDNAAGETVRIDGGGISVRDRYGKSVDVISSQGGSLVVTSQGEPEDDWRDYAREDFDLSVVKDELRVVTTEEEISFTLSDKILFDFDSADIRPAATDTLAKVAYLIRKEAKGNVVISGHTDSVGSRAYNQRLSENRAVSVMKWLRDVERIPATAMKGFGYGEDRPVADNAFRNGQDNPAGRARNRRVEIVIETVRKNETVTRVAPSVTSYREGPSFVCQGNQDKTIRGRTIEAEGVAVVAQGNCDLNIIDSTIIGSINAIQVEGNADVNILNSTIQGGAVSTRIHGNGEVFAESSTFRGRITEDGNAEFIDEGGNSFR